MNRGVRNATVGLINFRFLTDSTGQVCGRDVTDGSGRFSITAACNGLIGGPTFAVRIVLNNSVAEVKPEDEFAGTYTFQSAGKLNAIDTPMDFGIISITANQQAFQTHNLIMRAQHNSWRRRASHSGK